jgi:hypothetical protein
VLSTYSRNDALSNRCACFQHQFNTHCTTYLYTRNFNFGFFYRPKCCVSLKYFWCAKWHICFTSQNRRVCPQRHLWRLHWGATFTTQHRARLFAMRAGRLTVLAMCQLWRTIKFSHFRSKTQWIYNLKPTYDICIPHVHCRYVLEKDYMVDYSCWCLFCSHLMHFHEAAWKVWHVAKGDHCWRRAFYRCFWVKNIKFRP